jgi:hypothetical protein
MPTLNRLTDGHSTLIGFALAPGILLWQKEVTPPGYDGGGPNDITTMHNVLLRTKYPKTLYTMTQAAINAQYDPQVYESLRLIININQEVQVFFPNDGVLGFFGWLDSFKPNRHVVGEAPTAEVIVECSNVDNADPPAETLPLYTAP